MKVLILSDTHHAVEKAAKIIEKEQPDRILHLGDCVVDFNRLEWMFPDIPMVNVAGNCDNALDVPDSRFFTLEGHEVFMTHGHIYNVKYNDMRLVYAAQEVHAELVLFGHTHRPDLYSVGSLTVMNPGAAVMGSYGIVEATKEALRCSLHTLREEVSHASYD